MRTRGVRIGLRGLSHAACVVWLSQFQALQTRFQPLACPAWPAPEHTEPHDTSILNPYPACNRLRLRPQWHPVEPYLFESPNVIRPSHRHGWCPRPPHPGRAITTGGVGDQQPLAHTRVGSHDVVIDLEQHQLIPQAWQRVCTRRPIAATRWRIARLSRSPHAVLIVQPHAAKTCAMDDHGARVCPCNGTAAMGGIALLCGEAMPWDATWRPCSHRRVESLSGRLTTA